MAIFDSSNIVDKKFSKIDISFEMIEGRTFNHCSFLDSNLTDVMLKNCIVEDCLFVNCDLSLIKIPQTTFKDTLFKGCRMLGINWCEADWECHSLLLKKRVTFEECLLDHSLFIGLDLKETNFLNCKARQVDFESANLARAVFSGTDLQGTRFVNCDLSEANLSTAFNYAIDASQNKFHKTRFSLPEAISLLHSLDIILEENE